MSAAATLHSNHVNYLIWRYLQEQGFDHAANVFTREWRRTSDIASDPDALPFAHTVQRNDLVSVVQYGVHYDQTRAKAGLNNGERKFGWSKIDGYGASEGHRESNENGVDMRAAAAAAARRKEKLSNVRATAARAQRKTEHGSNVNGEHDAMDVDGASADGEPEQEPTSPTVASESDQAGPVERYDSMDISVQTDIKPVPKTSTISWLVDKPGASILQTLWNPKLDDDDTKTLLTVGNDICRFYQVPNSAGDAKLLEHLDEPAMSAECAVTAAAWRPDGTAACCALDSLRELPSGTQLPRQILLERHQDGTSTSLQLEAPSLEPPGVIFSVHYSPDSRFLLALRTNMKRSMIQVWPSSRLDVDAPPLSDPIAWRLFDVQVNDAVWTSDDTFVICGEQGLSALYQIDESQGQDLSTLPAGNVLMRGLISRNSNIFEGTSTWDRVRFDARHQVATFASNADRRLLLTAKLRPNGSSTAEDVEFELPEEKTLQPLEFSTTQVGPDTENEDEQGVESFLAAGYDDGSISLYSINFSPNEGLACKEVTELTLSEPPATALGWSPSGAHLAVANSNLIQIWSRDSFSRKNGIMQPTRATITWRPTVPAGSSMNGDANGSKAECEPSLHWSADGASIAFATEHQVSVIAIDDPAQSVVTANGHHSP
ncbi:Putative F-box-like/WD repeat-containing protein Ebi [Septoria linicola]|uniref:F-box-like/WD repeat-containing protein Ebi n=1 Tax=Septoria linicola TaxID=215465 RepID=A0A9Q9AIV1_9PEZI|nr:Putative F-box-like/WD repeat-containing protein Ebi [Septoria linicola]